MIFSLFFLAINLCFSNVTMHSLSHNCPIYMILKWEAGKISACFDCLDRFSSGIWDW